MEIGETITKHVETPIGCWPAVLRDEHAAADEMTVDAFLSRVSIWPKPFIDTGTDKGKFSAWRKIDLDRAIDPGSVSGVPEAY